MHHHRVTWRKIKGTEKEEEEEGGWEEGGVVLTSQLFYIVYRKTREYFVGPFCFIV